MSQKYQLSKVKAWTVVPHEQFVFHYFTLRTAVWSMEVGNAQKLSFSENE